MLFNIVVVGDDDDGTGGTIDEAQVKTIRDLLKQAHAADPVWSKKPAKEHETAFLRKIVRAPSIEEIPFRMYRKAKSELEDRIPSAHTL
jgi:delta 1-pyrroline-5-carboxylate dehydrogenase